MILTLLTKCSWTVWTWKYKNWIISIWLAEKTDLAIPYSIIDVDKLKTFLVDNDFIKLSMISKSQKEILLIPRHQVLLD